MPKIETPENFYEQEQIEKAKEWLTGTLGGTAGKHLAILLSALSTAERERDTLKDRERAICRTVGGVSDGGHYRADIIEHLQIVYQKAIERDALKAHVAELEARWISVEERLPEELRHVLCINARGTPFVAVYINKFFNDEYRLLRDPTHWMPLPEPPAIVGKKEG